MPRPRRVHCRQCGRHVRDCGRLTRKGACLDCGLTAATEAARQMHARSGPYWDEYVLRRTPRGVGGISSRP